MSFSAIRKIVAACAAWAGVAIAAPAIWDGSADVSWYESSAQAYNLTTAEQLAGLAKLVNEGISDFSGKTITLGADIFLNDTTGVGLGTWASVAHRTWTPIGTQACPFRGEFDGIAGKKNRKIYGLYYNDSSKSYIGLFGYTKNVQISNLDVLVGRVIAKDFVGALVGGAVDGSITNVHCEIEVTGRNKVGGLVGSTTSSISTSSAKGNIVGQDSVGGLVGFIGGKVSGTTKQNVGFVGNVTGRNYVGGVAGRGAGISKAFVSGAVDGSENYVGGVVGYTSGLIDSVYHIDGNVGGKDYVGGLAGYVSDSVKKSYSKGDIRGRNYVGGIAGQGVRISKAFVSGAVDGTENYVGGVAGYVSGTIDSVYHIDGNVGGKDYVGGLVGFVSSSVKKSYSNRNVTGRMYVGGLVGRGHVISNSYAEGFVKGDSNYVGGVAGYVSGTIDSVYHIGGNVSGSAYVGGLVGVSYGTSLITLQNSYAIGDVMGTTCVGGLLGLDTVYLMRIDTVNNSRKTRKVINSYFRGNVDGGDYVGGILGKINSNMSSYIASKISNSYHDGGHVFGTSDYVGGVAGYFLGAIDSAYHIGGGVKGENYVGGLAGQVRDSVQNSYSEGFVTGSSYVGGVVGYSTGLIDSVYHIGGDVGGVDYVGGVVGSVSSSVTKSHAKGNITGRNYVGGLVGKGEFISNSYADGFVKGDSNYVGGVAGYASGLIDSVYHIGGGVNGFHYVGGLLGWGGNTIKNSYSEGNITGIGNFVGGVAGVSYYSHSGKSAVALVSLQNTHAIGNVKGDTCVGGLIGIDYAQSTYGYMVTKKIAWSYSEGNVEGKIYVGGILGKSSANYSNYITSKISNSYHDRGHVLGTSNYVGGVAGYSFGSIDSSYHIGGDVKGNDYVGGLVGQVRDTVSKSRSEAFVKGVGNVGGLVGYGKAVLKSYAKGFVKGDSNYVGGAIGFATGDIDSVYHIGDVEGNGYVGGVAGNASGKIANSGSKGNVGGKNYVGGLIGLASGPVENSSSKGSINGTSFVGGLIGYAENSVTGSSSEGNVAGTGNAIGGLIGSSNYFYNGSLNVSIQTASNSYAIGNVSGANYVGGLVGLDSVYRNSSNQKSLTKMVYNSYSKGNVIGAGKYVGGIVGKSDYGYRLSDYKTNFYLRVISAYHENGNISGGDYVGGVAGFIGGTIDSSYHKGEIINGNSCVGGVAGGVTGSVTNSHSHGNVSGMKDSVGGVAGYVDGKIRNSYAKGDFVKGRNTIGGLVGYVGDSVDVSYFEGDSVTGIYQIGGLAGYAESAVDSSYSTAHVKGDDNVGGFIGSAYGDVSNSYAIGNVVGDVEHSSAGNDNLGGLVGYQYGCSIFKSMALGSVSGTTKVGGLVGRFEGTKISQSYANGNVTGLYDGDPAEEVGNYYIGGLVGYAKGALEETYASGIVKGIEEEPVYTGCVVGYVNGSLSVSKTYYDKTKCGLGIDGGEETATVSGSPDKTTAEMQTQETFVGWDFANTWRIMEKTYPFLQIYSNSLTNAVVTTSSLEGIKYDGTAKTPLVTSVTLFGESLEYETEYTITYKDNINAGTATINVCGVKPYGGCKVLKFDIARIEIEPTIAAIDNMTYTGQSMTPEIKVYNGELLLATTDYIVEYKDNVNSGTATVSVTMKGNYSGSASKTFTIEKATPVINQNPKASDVVLGQTLAASELSGGSANVDGEFVWKTPTIKPELENDGYVVVFVPTDTNYAKSADVVVPVKVLDLVYVTVHIGDNTLDSIMLIRGTNYTLPKVPDSTGYDFVGMYHGESLVGNTGDQIVISENTVIDAVYKVKTFVITFKNGSMVLQSSEVAYGVIPTAPTVTLPENTAQYTYSFVGWDKEIVAVRETAIYAAVIDSVVNKYKIVFKNYDDTELKDSLYEYGTIATKIAKPANPMREASAQYSYVFKSWTPTISDVTGDAVYTAVFDSIVNAYMITFVNEYDTLQSVKKEMEYGSMPVYEGMPTRESTAQYIYTFKEWTPEIVAVSEAATYTAVFDSSVQSYVVTFINDAEELQSDEIAYGVLPKYVESIPTKMATAQYTYNFVGWIPAIAEVTSPVTYKAIFDSTVNEYEIMFVNGSTILQSSGVAYGTMPTAPAVTLPKNTAQYTYSFRGWDKEIVPVTGNATYTAVIDSVVNEYEVVFKDYDGTVLKETTLYDYGTAASGIAKPSNPTRRNTAQYSYVFKTWSPSITDVIKDVVYTADYDSTIRSYTIIFKSGSTVLQSSDVAYGTMPTPPAVVLPKNSAQYTYRFRGWDAEIVPVTGNAIYTAVVDSVINWYEVSFKNYDGTMIKSSVYAYGSTIVKPADPTRIATVEFTYKFKGWTPIIASVTADAVYKAVFDSVARGYTIVFISDSDTLQFSSEKYGSKPSYKGKTPVKDATAQYEYTFKGWSPSIGAVSGDATYKAVFDSTVKKYAVTFVNGEKMLQTSSVAYGLMPKYTGATPTKASTKNYSYEFIGWSPKIEKVVGEAAYQAVFDSTKLTGIMNNQFINLEMSVSVVSRNIQISAAPVGSIYAILDMQGRVLKKGRVESANFIIAMPQAGNYLVRIGGKTKRVNVK